MLNDINIRILDLLGQRNEKLAAAESCTGGGIMKVLTDIPGSSKVFWGGIVAYDSEAKVRLLNVAPELLDSEGPVSQGVAKAMAWGIKALSGVDWAIAVTGIAAHGGAIWIAWSGLRGNTEAQKFVFDGNRQAVRDQAVIQSLEGLMIRLDRL